MLDKKLYWILILLTKSYSTRWDRLYRLFDTILHGKKPKKFFEILFIMRSISLNNFLQSLFWSFSHSFHKTKSHTIYSSNSLSLLWPCLGYLNLFFVIFSTVGAHHSFSGYNHLVCCPFFYDHTFILTFSYMSFRPFVRDRGSKTWREDSATQSGKEWRLRI